MASIGSSPAAGQTTVQPGQNPIIYNVVTPGIANIETSQALTSGTKRFTIRVRGISQMKLAYISGQSGTTFISIPKGTSYTQEGLNFTGTLFFQVDKISQTIEIIEWS